MIPSLRAGHRFDSKGLVAELAPAGLGEAFSRFKLSYAVSIVSDYRRPREVCEA